MTVLFSLLLADLMSLTGRPTEKDYILDDDAFTLALLCFASSSLLLISITFYPFLCHYGRRLCILSKEHLTFLCPLPFMEVGAGGFGRTQGEVDDTLPDLVAQKRNSYFICVSCWTFVSHSLLSSYPVLVSRKALVLGTNLFHESIPSQFAKSCLYHCYYSSQ